MAVPVQTFKLHPTFQLRPYQWKAALDLSQYIVDGSSSTALISPTGSGKSLVVLTILGRLIGRQVTSAVVATPFVQIEDGFYRSCEVTANTEMFGGSTSQVQITIDRDSFFLRPRTDDVPTTETIQAFLEAESPSWPVLLTTHAQLSRWEVESLPEDLTGRLLILDEGHHAGLSQKNSTRIGMFSEAWRKRGGQVLYVTATPFRADGMTVLPEGTDTHRWSITSHADSGWAPNDFQIRTVALNAQAATPREFEGVDLSPNETFWEDSPEAMVQKWVEDGMPKAGMIVPGKRSRKWVDRLKAALVKAAPDCRIVDAVGNGNTVRDRLREALEAEQEVIDYGDSQVDVIIVCKRFDEGTDWPLCSHVYNYGIPRSFGLIIQRWGRTLRDKSGIANHPFPETASITFFVPRAPEEVLDRYERQHHDHAFLLACYMADWETARKFGPELRIRFEKHWTRRTSRRSAAAAPKDVFDLFGMNALTLEEDVAAEGDAIAAVRAEQALQVADTDRAEIRALLLKWEAAFKLREKRAPTYGEATLHIESLSLSGKQALVASELLLTLVLEADPAAMDKVEVGIRGITAGAKIQPALRKVYRSVVDDYRDQTFAAVGSVLTFYTSFTGLDAEKVARRLCGRLHANTLLTLEQVREAIKAFHADHGFHPRATSGNAAQYFGFEVTWASVKTALFTGKLGPTGMTISKLALEMGLCSPPFGPLTLEQVREAIKAFHADCGRAPSSRPVDASEYFGFDVTWTAVNAALVSGRWELPNTSLSREARELGLRPTSLSEATIKEAVIAFARDFPSEVPPLKGDASAYFGRPLTWKQASVKLRSLAGRTVHQWMVDQGLVEPPPPPPPPPRNPTLEEVRSAMRAFHEEHGEAPKAKGDASAYFGRPFTWRGAANLLRKSGSSLRDTAVEMGILAIPPKRRVISRAQLVRGIRKYLRRHRVRPRLGDASPYLGEEEPIQWTRAAMLAGTSMAKVMREEGLWRYPTTEEIAEAIRSFKKKEGRHPGFNDGRSAARHLPYGTGVSWQRVHCLLRNREGSTLAAFCRRLGVIDAPPPPPPLSEDLIISAVQLHYEECGLAPSCSDGDASQWLGQPRTWGGVEGWLKHHKGVSLHGFVRGLGIVPRRKNRRPRRGRGKLGEELG